MLVQQIFTKSNAALTLLKGHADDQTLIMLTIHLTLVKVSYIEVHYVAQIPEHIGYTVDDD